MLSRATSRRAFLRLAVLSASAALAGCATSSPQPVGVVAGAAIRPAPPRPATIAPALPVPTPVVAQPARRVEPVVAPAGGAARRAQYSDVALSHPDVLQIFRADETAFALPPVRARIRLIGDMHFGFTSEARLDALADDLRALPAPDAVVTTGDEVHYGSLELYQEATTWLGRLGVPVHTVTGNHTFWSAGGKRRDLPGVSYQRWLDAFGEALPSVWELAGIRFVGVGPVAPSDTPADASIGAAQVQELASVLAQAPNQPTVVVMHSPLRHTVLADSLGNCYTSDQAGFFQLQSDAIHQVLAAAPQVALVITGHTHSPLRANGLLALVQAGDRIIPHFNAMAVPFLRKLTAEGPVGPQPLVTWELGIGDKHMWLLGRDHLTRTDVATAAIPLTPSAAAPSTSVQL